MSNREVTVLTYPRPLVSDFILRTEHTIPEPEANILFKVGLGKFVAGSFEQPYCKMTSTSFIEGSYGTIQNVMKFFTLQELSLKITKEEDGNLFISGDVPLVRDFSSIDCVYNTTSDFVVDVNLVEIDKVTSIQNGTTKLDNKLIEYNGFYQENLAIKSISFSDVTKGPLRLKVQQGKQGTFLRLLTFPIFYTLTSALDSSEYEKENVKCEVVIKGQPTSDVFVDVKMRGYYSLDIKFQDFPPLAKDTDFEVKCPTIDIVSYHPFSPLVEVETNYNYYTYHITSNDDGSNDDDGSDGSDGSSDDSTSNGFAAYYSVGLIVMASSLMAFMF